MAIVEFIGQTTRDADNEAAAPSRLLNCYRVPSGDRSRFVLRSVLGQTAFANTSSVFMRAFGMVSGALYKVASGALYKIDSASTVTNLGAVTDGAEASLSGNNGVITVTSAGNYYIHNGSISQPTAGAFSSFGSVEFVGGYTVLTEKDGRKFQWSALADATSLPALNFATTEGRDDKNIRAVAINGNIWIFKEHSLEIWYITGQANADAFARLSGGVVDTGLKAYNLVTKFDGGAFFVGDDGIAYLASGTTIRRVSTSAIEGDLKNANPTSCFYYEDEGEKFCIIRFSDRPSWVFSLQSGAWHERATGATHEPWAALSSASMSSEWYITDNVGQVSKLERSNIDGTTPLRRTAVSSVLYQDGARFRIPEFEIFARMGRSDISREAKVLLRMSEDGGQTFGRYRENSLGDLGQYETRAVFRSLGQFRQAVAEVSITDAAEISLYADARIRLA